MSGKNTTKNISTPKRKKKVQGRVRVLGKDGTALPGGVEEAIRGTKESRSLQKDAAEDKKEKQKNEKSGGFAKSIRGLAKALGKSDTAVRKWMMREDWPFALNPPWDVGQVRAWAEINLHPDPAKVYRQKINYAKEGTGEYGEIGALTRAKIQVTLERAMYIRQERLFKAGKLIDAGEVRRQWLAHIQAVKGQMIALPRSVSGELVGISQDRIEEVLTNRITEMLNDLAEK